MSDAPQPSPWAGLVAADGPRYDRDEVTERFSRNLRRHRKDRGLTQKQLAARSGTTQKAVYLWESRNRSPTLESLLLIAHGLGVEPQRLFE